MSTIKTTNVTHGSNSGTANIVLSSAGNLEARKINGCQRIILEQFFSPCDGSVIAASAGNITMPNVTAKQDGTTSFADLTGSSITYTPPSGATQVIYEIHYYTGSTDDKGIHYQKLLLDSDEVTKARITHTNSTWQDSGRVVFKWGFNIGGSADTTVGRVASWSSSKTIKLQVREHDSNKEQAFHEADYWDGSASDTLMIPCIGITAIG